MPVWDSPSRSSRALPFGCWDVNMDLYVCRRIYLGYVPVFLPSASCTYPNTDALSCSWVQSLSRRSCVLIFASDVVWPLRTICVVPGHRTQVDSYRYPSTRNIRRPRQSGAVTSVSHSLNLAIPRCYLGYVPISSRSCGRSTAHALAWQGSELAAVDVATSDLSVSNGALALSMPPASA